MKAKTRMLGVAIAVPALALVAGGAPAKEIYKLSSVPSGVSPYLVHTTFAKIIGKYVPDVEIQVNATGIVPRHAVDVATGKVHFFMTAPNVHFLMMNKGRMFARFAKAPEMAKKLRALFNYPFGTFHIATYADSGIKTLMDLKGKRVFLGPRTRGARSLATAIVEGTTGYKAGKDFVEAVLGFGPARQAFRDRQIDVIVYPSNLPSAFFSQIARANKIRFLGLTDADFKKPRLVAAMKLPGRSRGTIPLQFYGKNQVNTEPAQTLKTWVGLGTSVSMPEDVIYKMVKAFWEHLDEVHAAAPWMKDAVTKENIFVNMNMKLHRGAVKYYKEIGLKIPASALP